MKNQLVFIIITVFVFFEAVNASNDGTKDIEFENVKTIIDFDDPEAFDDEYSYGQTGSVVVNPHGDGNVYASEREAGDDFNNGVQIIFDEPVDMEDRNFIMVKIYSEESICVQYRGLRHPDHQDDPLQSDFYASGWIHEDNEVPNEWWTGSLYIETYGEPLYGVMLNVYDNMEGQTDGGLTWFDDIQMGKSDVDFGESTKTHYAKRVTDKQELDGEDLQPYWSDLEEDRAMVNNITMLEGTEESVPADGSNFRVLWDDDFLYFFVEVRDDSPTPPPDDNLWEYDCVEFFIDGQGRNMPGERLTGQYQIRVNYDSDILSGDDEDPDLFNVYGTEWVQGYLDKGGYTLEVALPWLAIYGGDGSSVDALGAGTMITFDMGISDHDPEIGDTRYTNVIWAGEDGEGEFHEPYYSSEYWGAIELINGELFVAEQKKSDQLLNIYPIPADNWIKAEMNGFYSYQIVDPAGVSIIKSKAEADNVKINTAGIKPGLYFIKAVNDKGETEMQKLIMK